ncbi:DUF1501 domain-containing protein [Nocardioides donggukensis]|uniref:DUF1501 domain-containing protein n=1 Tax=Nocardioides donggukensis TaxID=2774019 RepID=A0A927K4E4_9ACTN|nr:DUF1501 domain-containing protein [Nocardioides donggukensis]MBD8870019.1 DUF1501 domain-containing protein [Nocardioides donggukensis]
MSPTPTGACCPEFAAVSRRGLFRGAAALAGTSMLFGSTAVTASAAGTRPARNVLVVLSLRGAADGLSLVVPHGDPAYYTARPRLAVPADRLLAKDGFFGLHPALAPLVPLWDSGRLAAVHATGLPAPNRSHFAAMEEVEDADPGSRARVGWLNRLLGLDAYASPLQGLAIGSGTAPASLAGPQPFMAASGIDQVALAGDDKWDTTKGRRSSLERVWGAADGPLGAGVRSALASVTDFAPVLATPETPANGATYPSGDLGDALAAVARLVRGDVGTEVVTVDHGDWDMHTDVGTTEWGRLRTEATEMARAVAALFTDLGPLADKVTLVALSEFGRRVVENANWGLDHGYGNVMLLAGAGVVGGRYHGTWPGLGTTADADLMVTTDYRSVLAEVVETRFGASVPTVFPGLSRETVGVMRA